MTLRTAAEIVTNPRDLQIVITAANGGFGILINRGEERGFKPLLSTPPDGISDRKTALQYIERVLSGCVQALKTELENPDGLLTAVINPEGRPLDELAILSPNNVQAIIEAVGSGENCVLTKSLF